MSVCVCCTHLFSFFPLAFVLVNDLSLVSCRFLFRKCVRFCFCCSLFLFVVCTCILCFLPCLTICSFIDVLSCTTTGVSEIKFKKLDLLQPLCVCVCVCVFRIILYVNYFGRSVLYICIKYRIYRIM